MFDTPDDRSPALDLDTVKGSLVAIRVTGTGTSEMDWGPSDYIEGDVTIIEDAAGRPVEEPYQPGAAVYGKFIYNSLKRKVGRTVLGVITQGTEKIKGNYPWQFTAATPEQTERAVRFMAERPDDAAPAAADERPAWAK